MKLLFITNDLYPHLNANSEIVYRLAEKLTNKHRCEITVLGYNNSKDLSFPDPPYKINTVRMKSVTDYFRIKLRSQSNFEKNIKLFCNYRAGLYYVNCKTGKKDGLIKEYKKYIKRIVDKNDIDCVLAFSGPTDTLISASSCKTKTPVIAYKLDPWSTNLCYHGSKKEKEKEELVDKKVDKIITTTLIENEYKANSCPEILSKVESIEFPNIIKPAKLEKIKDFSDERIHCVFAGSLYKGIRNPKYAVDLFEKLSDKNIVFHIIGYFWGTNVLPSPLPDNIIYHERVSSEEAMRYMQSADVLVNIGNMVTNQLPSKIFTYISLCKPILNFIKTEECPTLNYLKDYPNAINVLETSQIQEKDVNDVYNFIIKAKNKNISFDEIEEKYRSCTPEFVGDKLYNIICDVILKHEKEKR